MEREGIQEELKEFEKKLNKNIEPLLKDLSKIGINIKSSWDLVNSPNYYDEAIPILLNHLQKDYHPKNLAGIARSLAIPATKKYKNAWDILVSLYKRTEPDENIDNPRERWLKESLAVAISYICKTDEHKKEVIKLIKDKSNGESRMYLVDCIAKRKMISKEERKKMNKDIYEHRI